MHQSTLPLFRDAASAAKFITGFGIDDEINSFFQ
jgi:hypothetical protein